MFVWNLVLSLKLVKIIRFLLNTLSFSISVSAWFLKSALFPSLDDFAQPN